MRGCTSNRARVLALALLLLPSIACGGVPAGRPTAEGDIRLSDLLPADCQLYKVYPFHLDRDFNGDGKPDKVWVVFYRFDLPEEGDISRAPIRGALYWTDSHRPAWLLNDLLDLPGGMYLCECDCQAHMENLISRSEGDELLITDHCNERVTRLIIYRRVPESHTCEFVTFFKGDQVDWERDWIETKTRLPSAHPSARSQLVERKVYGIHRDGEGGWQWVEKKREFPCANGVPGDPTLSPYPEKVVLAFYTYYTDTSEEGNQKLRSFFTDAGWGRVGGCWNGQCGCQTSREQVEYVRVVELQPALPLSQGGSAGETAPIPAGTSPADTPPPVEGGVSSLPEDRTTVTVGIVCEPACWETPPTFVVWQLIRERGCWLLDDAEVIEPMAREE